MVTHISIHSVMCHKVSWILVTLKCIYVFYVYIYHVHISIWWPLWLKKIRTASHLYESMYSGSKDPEQKTGVK